MYAVYYKKRRKLTPATHDRQLAENALKRLSGIFQNITVEKVGSV